MDRQTIIEKLFSVGAHYGFASSRRHPSTAPFIFGNKGGMDLFDLEKTANYLENALNYIKSLAAEKKTILFVGGKAEARVALKRAAERLGMPFVAGRWIGGSLTNFGEIKKRLARLTDATDQREQGLLAKFTKRERLLIDREITDLEDMFGGLKGMNKLPDAIFMVDPKQESGAVAEATQLNIPVIALMSTDCDRSQIQFPIPANDSSVSTIGFILDEVAKNYLDNLKVGEAAPTL